MENLRDKIFKMLRLDNMVSHLSGYVETRLELYKLEIREDVGKVLAKAFVYGVLLIFAMLCLVFFSVGLAHFINSFFEGAYTGYWIVAGFYGVAFLLFLVFRKGLDRNFEKHFTEMIKRKAK